ncbi:MAG: D-alanine--D-alanine ligase family protein [Acidobacteriota bacterium]|nr:D-alanine--D-alanine ligase family protein [Acidobacteriota bacterium]
MSLHKLSVCILFGGRSAEHEISILSATAILRNLDRDRFVPQPVYINREGMWRSVTEKEMQNPDADSLQRGNFQPILPWQCNGRGLPPADICFPVLHGPNGEDGRVPALLELAGMPFVGAGSLGSALAMDKGVAKQLFRAAGIDTPDFLIFTRNRSDEIRQQVCEHLDWPVFVKPCNLGSSVGISKVKAPAELAVAVDLAFRHDSRIIVERGITGREIEVAVMGNDRLEVSLPGELTPHNEFYDYADKYIDGKTSFTIPADLDENTAEKIRDLAARAFRCLYLAGLSRVDFFLEQPGGRILVNEINTMPGFTEISMFPKLFILKGYTFQTLVTRLLEYGLERHRRRGDQR